MFAKRLKIFSEEFRNQIEFMETLEPDFNLSCHTDRKRQLGKVFEFRTVENNV